MTRHLILGLLPPLGGSLKTLADAGQHVRLIEQYLCAYAGAFDETLYFSYASESLAQYTDDAALRAKVSVLPGGPGRSYTFRMPFRWARDMQRCRVLRVFQITGVIPAILARIRWGTPFVATYGYRYAAVARVEGYRRRAALLYALEQLGLRTASAIIVTTSALLDHVTRYIHADRVHLIPNSVNTQRFVPAPSLPGRRRLVFVGRVEPQKNLLSLIRAVSRISPAPELVVVGDGSQRQELVGEAAQLGVHLDVRGVISYETVPGVLQTADAFVLPSLIEGHPKALLEAMSCGLPCVGLDVPGTRDVIAHGQTGILCPPTVEGLSAGLSRALDQAGLARQLGHAARAWVEENYSAASVMRREVGLLQQMAGAPDS